MVHRIFACLLAGGVMLGQASVSNAQVTFSFGTSPTSPRVMIGQPPGFGYNYGNPYGQPGYYGNPNTYQPGYTQPYYNTAPGTYSSGYNNYYAPQPSYNTPYRTPNQPAYNAPGGWSYPGYGGQGVNFNIPHVGNVRVP